MAENEDPSRQSLMNKASNRANQRLKKAHLDEWNGYMAEEAGEYGIEWKPKASPEQKAEANLKKILDNYPHLAEKVAS